jgi:hypothetical protein
LHRRGYPRTMIALPGIPKAEAKDLSDQLTDPPAGATYVHNIANIEVASDSPTTRGNYQPELEYLQQRKVVGLGSMYNKLLENTGSFSYASSKVGDRNDDIMVWKAQSRFALTTELSILCPVLDQNGFDSIELEPKFEFNIPESPETYTVADVLNAMKADPSTGKVIISIEEGRQILADFALWNLDPGKDPNAGLEAPDDDEAPTPAALRTASPNAQQMIDKAVTRSKRQN